MVQKALQYSSISVEPWDGMGMQVSVSMLVEPGLRIIPSVGLSMQTQLLVLTTVKLSGPIWFIN